MSWCKKAGPTVIICISLLGGGCASNEKLEAAIAHAQTTADDALRQAKAANMKADEALRLIRGTADDPATIMSTRQIAEKALKEAGAAKEAVVKANKRAERMFQKALAK